MRRCIASFARRVFYLGAAGRGHTAKLVVNLVLGLNRVVLSEGLGLAHRAGLDLAETLEILKASAARSEVMESQGARMLAGDFERPVARLAQHAKDVGLILALAAETRGAGAGVGAAPGAPRGGDRRRLGRARQRRGDQALPAALVAQV